MVPSMSSSVYVAVEPSGPLTCTEKGTEAMSLPVSLLVSLNLMSLLMVRMESLTGMSPVFISKVVSGSVSSGSSVTSISVKACSERSFAAWAIRDSPESPARSMVAYAVPMSAKAVSSVLCPWRRV